MANEIESQKEVLEKEGETETCLLCCKDIEIYSIGDCDHPICHECSTRMRVLCDQNDCPVCRRGLHKVIFTYDKLPYRELEEKNRSRFYSKKYKIGFYSADIQQAFFNLLNHPCPKCPIEPFHYFEDLKNHVLRKHGLYYCDICTKHLKIFTYERRCYTRSELALHRTKGDPDNTSHRGHPMCEFCKTRFLDCDELFRHSRREHEYCHFCELDGVHEFYEDIDSLAYHFRNDHYLCEEGACGAKPYISVFRNEIEYKAHVANVHRSSLNKQQTKQKRALQLDLGFGRHGRRGHAIDITMDMRSRRTDEMDTGSSDTSIPQAPQERSMAVGGSYEEDFPALDGASGSNVSMLCPNPQTQKRSRKPGKPPKPMTHVVAKQEDPSQNYVPVGRETEKVQLVRKQEPEDKTWRRQLNTNVPNINSVDDFPTLGKDGNKPATRKKKD